MKRSTFHPRFLEGLRPMANAIGDKCHDPKPVINPRKPNKAGDQDAKRKRRAEAARKEGLL